MNNKGKVIIASILFIFLGLTVFTFANPNEDENTLNSVTKNEITNNNQITDIFNQEDNNDDDNKQQNNNNVTPVVNNSYENAQAAVINAEVKVDETSYNEALRLVALVENGENKEQLTNRLESVKYGINVKKLVTTLETMTNTATIKEEMDAARTYRLEENVVAIVETVAIEALKEDLQTRLNNVAKILDDEELILNIADNALLKTKTKIEIIDQNDLTILLTDVEGTREIQNGDELTDGIYILNVKDKALNEIEITFTIDTNAPELTIESPETYQLEVYTEYIDKGYSAIDNLDGDITNLINISYYFKERETNEYITTDKIDNSKVGTYKITYTTTDKVGNATVGTREVEYVDTIAPTINLPGTIGLNKNELHVESGTKVTYEDLLAMVEDATAEKIIAPHKATLYAGPTIEDNIYNITDFKNGLDTNYVGRYNVEYKVTDKGGNTTTKTMLLVMTDTIAPTINLPGTIGLNKNELHVESGTKVTYEDLLAMVEDATAEKIIAPHKATLYAGPTIEDNIYNITDFTNGLDTNYVGRYNVEYKVTDKGGNTTTKTMLLVMTDTIAPTINLPGTIGLNKNELHVESGTKVTYEDLLAMVEDATAEKTIAPYSASLLISDIASENIYNITDFTNGLDTNYVGRYNVEYKVTDKGGNTTTKTMLLMILDTKKPILTTTITNGITYVKAEDSTHIVFNIYKDGELKKSFSSKTSSTGKEFTLTIENYGEGEYTIEAIDEANNKTTIKTLVTLNEILGIKYNDSVKLTKNGTLEEIIEFTNGQDKVIDLNGYSLTIKNINNNKEAFKNDGKLTIKNGTLVTDTSSNGLVENLQTGELVLDKVTIEDNGNSKLINNNGGNVTIKNNTKITLKNAHSAIENNGGQITVKQTIIDGNYAGKVYPVRINSGTALIEDTNISSPFGGINIWGGTITITNVNVKINPVSGITAQHAIYITNEIDSNVTINSGTFAGRSTGLTIHAGANGIGKITVKINDGVFSSTKKVALNVVKEGSASVSLNIKGGTFKQTNIINYLDEKSTQDLSNWEVIATEISEIKNNNLIKLTKDGTLEEIISITKGQNKTIDLNGYTLNVNSNDDSLTSIKNNGKLTIENGTLVTSTLSNGLVENLANGELILNNVIISDTGKEHLIENNGGKVTITNSNIKIENTIAAVAHNGGELVIKDTQIKANNTNPGYPLLITDGEAVIEKTNIDGKYGGINIKGGTIIITDVNVTLPKSGSAYHAIYIANVKDSNVTINGGTFAGRRGGLYLHALSKYTGEISVIVNDGTFSANKDSKKTVYVDSATETQVNLTIKGGTFIKDDVTEYLAEGYKQNEDGSVTAE